MTPQQTDRLITALEAIASRIGHISDALESIAYDTDAAKECSTAQQLLSTIAAISINS